MAYNTGRTGWNQRGGSDLYHFRLIQMQQIEQARQLNAAFRDLHEAIGPDAFWDWYEGHDLDNRSPEDGLRLAREEIERLGPCIQSTPDLSSCHNSEAELCQETLPE